MVTLTQTSWLEHPTDAIIQLLRTPPIRLEASQNLIHYHAPENLVAGSTVFYHLISGFNRISWSASISAVKGSLIQTRLLKGPFRGFNAKHHFENEDGVSICIEELSFQGESEHFLLEIQKAKICYALQERQQTLDALLKYETAKNTKSFQALDSLGGMSAG